MMFGFGMGELLLVSFIVLLLFGKRIPATMKSLGKSLGESVKSFRKGMIDEKVSEQQNILS